MGIYGTAKKIHESFPAELVGGLENAVHIAIGLMSAGSLFIASGLLPRLGCVCFIAFLVPATYFVHVMDARMATDPKKKTEEIIMVMKNASLIGAALMLFGYECAWAAERKKSSDKIKTQ